MCCVCLCICGRVLLSTPVTRLLLTYLELWFVLKVGRAAQFYRVLFLCYTKAHKGCDPPLQPQFFPPFSVPKPNSLIAVTPKLPNNLLT